MADILFIKTSSLGDVIHHMPALTDARRHRSDARLTWLVEEDCAPLVRLHPAVDDVIPVASRRWRRNRWRAASLAELLGFVRDLRGRRFDAIVDTQGLLRTALMARTARGERHGYDSASIREAFASPLYNVRHSVSKGLHAVERNRLLSGLALGYQPQGAADYGLDRSRLRSAGAPYAVLLHATARPEKEWPVEHWIALRPALARYNIDIVVPWGSDDERARAERIASALSRARVAARRPLDEVARIIAGASFVIGVDTGLLHLAASMGVPLVGIFSGSQPGLTGPVGQGPIEVTGTLGTPPQVEDVAAALARVTG